MKQVKGPSEDYLSTFKPLEVYVPRDERLEESIRKFRTLVTRERIMSDLKEHQSYEKPSEKRRRKIRESIQRRRKMEYMAKAATGNQRKNGKQKDEDDFER